MNDEIIQFVKDNWQEKFKGVSNKTPKKIEYLQVSHSHTKDFEKGRIILLIFIDDYPRPKIVAKFTRDKSYEKNLIIESRNSELLNRQAEANLYPKILTRQLISTKLVIFEEFVEGISLNAYIRNNVLNKNRDIKSITEDVFSLSKRIINLQNKNRKELTKRELLKTDLNELIAKFRKNVDLPENIYAKLVESRNYILSSKIKIYHGIINLDFVPSNIIKDKEKTRIIDLEFSEVSSLSFLEPIRFLYYYVDLLTDLNVFGTDDFPTNLGFVAYDKKHWLNKLINKYYGDTIDILLLPDYFLLCLAQDTLLRLYVEKISLHYRKPIINNTLNALTRYRRYLLEVIARKTGDVQYLQRMLKRQEQSVIEKAENKEEIEMLRSEIAAIKSSRSYKLFNKFKDLKTKVFGLFKSDSQ